MRACAPVAVLLLLLLPQAARAEEDASVSELLGWVLGQIDLSGWDAYFRQARGEETGLPVPSELVDALVYDGGTDAGDRFLSAVYALTKDALPQAAALLTALAGLALLTGVAEQLLPTENGVRTAAMLSLRAAAGCLCLLAVWRQVAACRDAMTGVQALSDALLPVACGMLTLFGQTLGAAALQAGAALFSGAIAKGLYGLVFPLAVMGGVTGVIDALRGRGRGGVSGTFFGVCRWTVGACTAGFVLLSSLRGAAAAASDGLLLRTGKLAAGSLPMMGGLVGGSLDTVFSLLTVVRSAVGLAGVALAVLWLLRPALKLALYLFALKAAAFLCEPLGAGELRGGMQALSQMLGILLSALVAAGAMLGVMLGTTLSIGKGVG